MILLKNKLRVPKGIMINRKLDEEQLEDLYENYKEKVLSAKDRDTIVTGKSLGHPVRALKNRMTREFQAKELDPNTTSEELEAMGAGALRKAAIDGDVKYGSCMCGQIAGLVKSEGTCEEIIKSIYNVDIEIIVDLKS